MLDSLRSFSKTWIAKILFVVLIISFAAFGINNVIYNLGGNIIARVGDEDITARQFQRAYSAQINALAQQLGSVPTADQAMALGLPSAALSRLASEAAVNKLARDFNLGASDQRLGEMLRQDPTFAGTLGAFSPDVFKQVLAHNGFTEAEYFEAQTKLARRQQIATSLFGDADVPKAAQTLVQRYTSDKRTMDYFVLNSTSLPPIADPTEEQLQAYLTEHQADFRTVETRTADILTISPAILAAAKTVSEEDIAAEYERTKANLVKPETREIVSVNLDEAGAAAFAAGQAEGKTFDQLVTESALKPTDIGLLSKQQVTDAALADAAFGLAKVGDFAIIDGVQGKRAVSVKAIDAGGEVPLAEAHDAIAKSLALTQAKAEYGDVLDQIEELRAAFQPMQTIADRFKLKLSTVPVSASGAELSAVPDIPEAGRAKVATTIFNAEVGKLAPTVMLDGNQNVWIDLKSVEPARDQTLAEVHDKVAAAWTLAQTEAALKAEVDTITAQLKAGTPIADIAVAHNQFPQLSQPFNRQGDGTSVINAAVAGMAFEGGVDHYGAALDGDGDYVVFKVVEIMPATDAPPATLVDYIDGSVRDALYGEFVKGLQDDAGLRVNDAALQSVLATLGQ